MFNCPTSLVRYGRSILHQPLSVFLRQSHNYNHKPTRDFSSITEPVRIVNVSSASEKLFNGDIRSSFPFGNQASEHFNITLRPKFSVLIDFMVDREDLKSIEALWYEMRQSNIEPDVDTYNSLITFWGRKQDLARIKEIRRDMIEKNVTPNSETFCILLTFHIYANDANGVSQIVTEAREHKITLDLYTTKKLADFYERNENVVKDLETFNFLIESFGKNHDLEAITKLREEMNSLGIKPNTATFRALAKYYEEKGTLAINEFMDEMQEIGMSPDVDIFRAFVKSTIRKKDSQTALKLWKEMQQMKVAIDLPIFNALISHYSIRNHPEISVPILRKEMEERGIRPDITTFQQLTRYYAQVNDMKAITQLIVEMKELNVQATAIYRILCGFFERIDVTVDQTKKKKDKLKSVRPDLEMFKALIDWFAELGDTDTLGKIKTEMVKRGIQLDDASKQVLLNSFVKVGDTKSVQELLEESRQEKLPSGEPQN